MREKYEAMRKHKLLTDALRARFKELGEQDIPNPVVVTKFFHPFSNWTWYAIAYNEYNKQFFGLIDGHESELGYFSYQELEETIVKGLPLERDCSFKETNLDEIRRQISDRKRIRS